MEQTRRQPLEYVAQEETTLLPFLLERVKGRSRNAVKSILSSGQVQVDGRTATRHDHPLLPGQRVVIRPEGGRRAALPFPVLYEDARLLVVDKPAGLLSMASDRERERTAYRMVTDYVRGEDPAARVFIVHRLDRDTSGVLLFAKDEEMKRALQDGWERLVLRRAYAAVVEGAPPRQADTVRTLLRENAAHKVYSVRSGGKQAVTRYALQRQGEGYALLSVEIDTGRKNQIRAHLSELGCPVAGDRDYGAATNPLRRLCLHARELALRHPVTGEEAVFRAPLPRGFAALVRTPGPPPPAPGAAGSPGGSAPARGNRKRN